MVSALACGAPVTLGFLLASNLVNKVRRESLRKIVATYFLEESKTIFQNIKQSGAENHKKSHLIARKITQNLHEIESLRRQIMLEKDSPDLMVKLFDKMESLIQDSKKYQRSLHEMQEQQRGELFQRIIIMTQKKQFILDKVAHCANAVSAKLLLEELTIKLNSLLIPAVPTATPQANNIQLYSDIQESFNKAEEELDHIAKFAETSLRRILLDRVTDNSEKIQLPERSIDTLMAEFLAERTEEKPICSRVEELLTRLTFETKQSEVSEIRIRYEQISREKNREKRLLRYEDLVLYCDGLLKEEETRKEILHDLHSTKLQLIRIATPAAIDLLPEVERLKRGCTRAELETFETHVMEVLKNDIESWNQRSIGVVMADTFMELGYEVEEDFDMVLISNSKQILHKPSMKDYHVQVVSNSAQNMVQVEMIRSVEEGEENSELSQRQALRDQEAEEEFCQDYFAVVETLKEQGIDVSQKMMVKPGEVSVRRVANANIAKGRTQKKRKKREGKREKKL
jgi:hypothetical protein